ncbi:MAG: flagellar basal body rod protein FlgB [Planctomycetaceae bacterium]|nr:flagellar basal body rod protein FlgB [Planctomycetales bacterium]MCB9924775.1 flagellar basal body rod protein FlgB [Planctomycetaceae bacterium]
MNIFQSTTIPVLQEVIGFAQARHEVLAGNVANVDTPGYRLRDLSVETFQQRLREAIDLQEEAGVALSPGEINQHRDKQMQLVRDTTRDILFHDGSDVGMEQQVLEISKNQYLHNMAITIMGTQFRMLQTAISERV